MIANVSPWVWMAGLKQFVLHGKLLHFRMLLFTAACDVFYSILTFSAGTEGGAAVMNKWWRGRQNTWLICRNPPTRPLIYSIHFYMPPSLLSLYSVHLSVCHMLTNAMLMGYHRALKLLLPHRDQCLQRSTACWVISTFHEQTKQLGAKKAGHTDCS